MTVDDDIRDGVTDGTPTRRRQFVVRHLDEVETPETVDELTDAVVDWERDRSPGQLDDPDRPRVREHLVEVDLPTLDEAGLVTFNPDEGIVGTYDGDVRRTEPVDSSGPAVEDPPMTPALIAVSVLAACLVIVVAVVGLGVPASSVSVATSVLVLVAVAVAVVLASSSSYG